MSLLLSQRTAAWWAFVDQSREHDGTTKKKQWKSIAIRIASERSRAKLYLEWHRLHTLCHITGQPSQTAQELVIRDAPASPSEPRSDSKLAF